MEIVCLDVYEIMSDMNPINAHKEIRETHRYNYNPESGLEQYCPHNNQERRRILNHLIRGSSRYIDENELYNSYFFMRGK